MNGGWPAGDEKDRAAEAGEAEAEGGALPEWRAAGAGERGGRGAGGSPAAGGPGGSGEESENEEGGRVNAIDRHVGARLRGRRVMLGLTQQQLAEAIGVTYQQAHKYERGHNRLSAGRLYVVARALGVPVSWFFEGLEEGGSEEVGPSRQLRELAQYFLALPDSRQREAVLNLLRAMARAARPASGTGGEEGRGPGTEKEGGEEG
jgi:transcriptional regulator with XRE-family HTH domain